MKPNGHIMDAWDLYFMHRVYYWTIGGVVTAAQKAFTFAHAESIEFLNALSVLLMGTWLLFAAAGIIPVATLFTPSALFIPRWAFGLLLIAIGRVGIHCMLSNSANKREWGLFFTIGAWLYLSALSCVSHGFGFVAALFLLAASLAGILYWIIVKEPIKSGE